MRLARTEINMAYRRADMARYNSKGYEFILGYEVKLSEMHPVDDICNDLQGDYPKDFVFSGWHPQCLCYVVPKLPTIDEMADYLNADMPDGYFDWFRTDNMPNGFVSWCGNNKDRIQLAKARGTLPYFIKYNGKYVLDSIEQFNFDRYITELRKDFDILDSNTKSLISLANIGEKDYIKAITFIDKSIIENTYNNSDIYSRLAQESKVIKGLVDSINSGNLHGAELAKTILLLKQKSATLTRYKLHRAGELGVFHGGKYHELLTYVGIKPNHLLYNPTSAEEISRGLNPLKLDLMEFRTSEGKRIYITIGSSLDNITSPKRIEEVIRSLPRPLKKHYNGILLTSEQHPLDKFYEIEYGKKGFQGAMYSGEPISVHMKYNNNSDIARALRHEIGHHCEKYIGDIRDWRIAQYNDVDYPTEYSENSWQEDFAESFSIFFSKSEKYEFMRKFPARTRILLNISKRL